MRASLSRERQEGAFLENLALYEHLATPLPGPANDSAGGSPTRLMKRSRSAPNVLIPTPTPEQAARRKAAAAQRKAAAEKAAAEAMDVATTLAAEVVTAMEVTNRGDVHFPWWSSDALYSLVLLRLKASP